VLYIENIDSHTYIDRFCAENELKGFFVSFLKSHMAIGAPIDFSGRSGFFTQMIFFILAIYNSVSNVLHWFVIDYFRIRFVFVSTESLEYHIGQIFCSRNQLRKFLYYFHARFYVLSTFCVERILFNIIFILYRLYMHIMGDFMKCSVFLMMNKFVFHFFRFCWHFATVDSRNSLKILVKFKI